MEIKREIYAPESLFISFEGGEGCGKTTQEDLLYKALKKYFPEKNILKTREPGGTEISEKIREILLDKKNALMGNRTEALLYSASRAQHCEEKIIPILNNYGMVLTDRFFDSTFAYQGAARKLDRNKLKSLTNYATFETTPDITIFLDVKPEIGIERAKGRAELDRLESEKIDFHYRVRNGFLSQAKMYPDRIIVIEDPNKSKNEGIKIVHYKIIDKINEKFSFSLEYQL